MIKRVCLLSALALFVCIYSMAIASDFKQSMPALQMQSLELKGLRALPDKVLDIMALSFSTYQKSETYLNTVRNDVDSGVWPLLCKSKMINFDFGMCNINSIFITKYTFKGKDADGLLVYELPFDNPNFKPYTIKFKVAEEDDSYCIVPSEVRISSASGCFIDPWQVFENKPTHVTPKEN